jgi:hypothetical protein
MTHDSDSTVRRLPMRYPIRSTIGVLSLLGLLPGCRSAPPEAVSAEPPSHVEHIEGSALSRVTLSEHAIERLGLQTGQIAERATSRSDTPRPTVPYSSLLYDTEGRTWVYTSPQPRTFVRAEVVVDYIEGETAVLSDGPPAGTVVATVGVAELYGTEFTVGH